MLTLNTLGWAEQEFMNKISKSKVIISRTNVKYNVDTEYPQLGRTRVYEQDFKVKGYNFMDNVYIEYPLADRTRVYKQDFKVNGHHF